MAAMTDRVRVRFGWAANPTEPLSGVTWTDESTRVRSVTISRGRDQWPGTWRPGTATIVLRNTDGALDIDDATYGSRLKPGRAVIVEGKDSGGTWRPLFTGHVRSRGGYTPTDVQGAVGHLTVTATDMLGTLAEAEILRTLITIASSDVADWITEALDLGGYGSADASISATTSTGTTSTPWNGSAAALAQRGAASDGGDLYCLTDGTVNYDGRHDILTVARLNSTQFTLTDTDPVPSGDVGYNLDAGVTSTWGDRSATAAKITDYTGTAYVTPSRLGDHDERSGTYDAGPTFADASTAESVASWWVQQTSQITAFPRTATINVATTNEAITDDHLDFACLRELRDRGAVEYTPPGRSQRSHTVTIESLVHRIDDTAWNLDVTFLSCDYVDATGWSTPGWFVLGTSVLGSDDILAY